MLVLMITVIVIRQAMTAAIRNTAHLPRLQEEGIFLKPIITVSETTKSKEKHRLWCHQTLSSARRCAFFKPFSDRCPEDYLDVVLTSTYRHEKELFPEKTDVYFQPETLGYPTWRRLRNTEDPPTEKSEQIWYKDFSISGGSKIKVPVIPYKYNSSHRVLISGMIERKHLSAAKLMNSSHHSSQTNPGFSRQPMDGNVYQY